MQRRRELSDTEFLDRFKRVVDRLDSHIVSLDSGEIHARDDIAAMLRVLVARGKGDDALTRFLKRMKVPQPTRQLAPPPKPSDATWVHVGSLPLFPEEDEGSGPAPVKVPRDLRVANCLALRVDDALEVFTWEDLILGYANTAGVHLDSTIPDLLDRLRLHGAIGVDLGTMLLRSLGVLISSVSHEVLVKVRPGHSGVQHDHYFLDVHIAQFMVDRTTEGVEFVANVQRRDWSASGPFILVKDDDDTVYEFGSRDGKLYLAIQEPD